VNEHILHRNERLISKQTNILGAVESLFSFLVNVSQVRRHFEFTADKKALTDRPSLFCLKMHNTSLKKRFINAELLALSVKL